MIAAQLERFRDENVWHTLLAVLTGVLYALVRVVVEPLYALNLYGQRQQLVDASIGYVPALAPAVPTVMKLLAAARRDGKSGAATA